MNLSIDNFDTTIYVQKFKKCYRTNQTNGMIITALFTTVLQIYYFTINQKFGRNFHQKINELILDTFKSLQSILNCFQVNSRSYKHKIINAHKLFNIIFLISIYFSVITTKYILI